MSIRDTSVSDKMQKRYYAAVYSGEISGGRFTTLPPASSFVPIQTSVTRPLQTQSVSTVNTPGYFAKKSFRVQFWPKKPYIAPPAPPRFEPPRYVTRKFRSREPRIPDVSKVRSMLKRVRIIFAYHARHDRYLAKLKRFKALEQKRIQLFIEKRAAYVKKYDTRRVKYEKQLEHYQNQVWLLQHGVMRYKKVRANVSGKTLQNNPYSLTRVRDFGFNGIYTDTTRARKYPANPSYYEKYAGGPYIAIQNYYEGYLGNTNMTYKALSATPLVATANARAISKIYDRLNAQDVHVAQVIAERAQTAELIGSTARRLASLISGKRLLAETLGVAKSGLQTGKNIANDFLAFQFGVKPLLSDVFGSAKSLARLANPDAADQVLIHAQATESDYLDVVTPNVSTGVKIGHDNYSTRVTVKVSYALTYKIVNGPLAELQKLGLVNPAEVAWELMPWSFVVDWFLPIGNYITSLSAGAGLEYQTGTKTVTTTTLQRAERVLYGVPQGAVVYGQELKGGFVGTKETVTKVRTVLAGPPSPRIPSFKSPLSLFHVLDSIALLGQRLK